MNCKVNFMKHFQCIYIHLVSKNGENNDPANSKLLYLRKFSGIQMQVQGKFHSLYLPLACSS